LSTFAARLKFPRRRRTRAIAALGPLRLALAATSQLGGQFGSGRDAAPPLSRATDAGTPPVVVMNGRWAPR